MINKFFGKYRFLSNFWPALVTYEGEVYTSTEAAYQAAKTLDKEQRKQIQNAGTPGKAKRLGRSVTLRPDWDKVRYEIMADLTKQKFRSPPMKRLLLETGDQQLIEGNTWHDNYWGICSCARCSRTTFVDFNNLGKILMSLREGIRQEEAMRNEQV